MEKKTLKWKPFFFILLVIFLSFFSFKSLIAKGYFPMHDDIHVLRFYEMEKCFQDKQIPCRWAPDLDAGYGQPLFNYYSPLPFYLGTSLRIFHLQFIDIIKILFALTLLVSGIFMFFLTREFFGDLGGLVGSMLYVYAPYRAVNIYVRGALAESLALMFIPAIFFFVYKYIKKEEIKYFVASAITSFFLFLSHNITNMIFFPVLIIWCIFWLLTFKKMKKTFLKVVSIFLIAVGLSSFFLLPAILEKKFVSIDSLRYAYYDFRLHFVYKGQLFFSRYWDYGPSLGADSRMPFQIGWPHWWLVIASLPLAIYLFLKKKFLLEAKIIFSCLVIFSAAVFLTHRDSRLIWENLTLLQFVQFPWRFLGIIIFSASFLGGGLIFLIGKLVSRKIMIISTVLVLLVTFFLNFGYFKPSIMHTWITDEYKLSKRELESQMKAALIDFLPITVKKVPEKIAPIQPWSVSGAVDIKNFLNRSNYWSFDARVQASEEAVVRVPVLNFPGWKVLIDKNESIFKSDNEEGVIEIKIPSGNHLVLGKFTNTPLRTSANIITILSFVLLAGILVFGNKQSHRHLL